MGRRTAWLFAGSVGAAACAEPQGTVADGQPPVTGTCTPTEGDSDPYADCIDAFVPGPGASFGHDALPDIVLGPPQPGPAGGGGTDVASLGCGGSITLFFDGDGITDRPGPDLVVFENAFTTGDTTFTEPAEVLVSQDGEVWHRFGCAPAGDGVWPPEGCAGVTPTAADADPVSDPGAAGGDAFDLADVGLRSARWLRLVDVTEAHYGADTWCDGAAGGFDLDAAAAVEPRP